MSDPQIHEKIRRGRPLSEKELMDCIKTEMRRQVTSNENDNNENGERFYTLIWSDHKTRQGYTKKVLAKSSDHALSICERHSLNNISAYPVILPDNLTWRSNDS